MSHDEIPHHLHEFGKVDNVVHIDNEWVPKVVQTPMIHQYIENGKVHRGKYHRAVGQFELFLDLIMVGVVHLMAEDAANSFTGLAVARFALTFWGAWSIWSDYRNYANTCGTDDLPQRIYIFVVMALLIGYTANATGFEIHHGRFENKPIDEHSMKACVAYLLVAKLTRFILHVFYGWYIPEHLVDQWSHACVILVASALYLGSMFSPTINTGAVLFGCAGLVENLSILMGPISGTLMEYRRKRRSNKAEALGIDQLLGSRYARRIAITNIEHATERNGGVYILVLGESITSLLYTVSEYPESVGINPFYGRAFMVLMVSYCLNWMYFTLDWNVHKVHPVRRHWLTAILYTFLHWPLCSGLVLSSAGVVHLVRDRNTHPAARWYWGGGTSVAIACLCVLDILPKWDFWNPLRRAVFTIRLILRVTLSAACALLPLIRYDRIDNLQFLGIYASLLVFIMTEELVGKILVMHATEKLNELKKEREEQHPELKKKPDLEQDGVGEGDDDDDDLGNPNAMTDLVPDTNFGSLPDSGDEEDIPGESSGSTPQEKPQLTQEHILQLREKKYLRRRSDDSISEISIEPRS